MKAVLILLAPEPHEATIPELDRQFGARNWRQMSLEDAEHALAQRGALGADLVFLGVETDDPRTIERCEIFVQRAAAGAAPVVLITANVSPAHIHQLLGAGAAAFVPYPIPDGALDVAIRQSQAQATRRSSTPKRGRSGAILSVFHFAGGAGATTLAVNLAWELATLADKGASIGLIDFDFQYGGVSSFLDLPERPAVGELFTQTGLLDDATYRSALLNYRKKLSVQTSPPEIIPLDAVDPRDIAFVLDHAEERFDITVIDMPLALTRWSETVLKRSSAVLSVLKADVRDARNLVKFVDTLRDEGLSTERLQPVINFAPTSFDFTGKSRIKKFEEGIGLKFQHALPKGGDDARRAADRGVPIADISRRNPLRTAIVDLAHSYLESAEAPAPQPARAV